MKERNFMPVKGIFKKLFDKDEKDLWLWFWALVGGLFFSVTYHFGKQLDTNGNVNFTSFSTWGWTLGTAAVLTPLLAYMFILLSMYKKEPVSIEGTEVSDYNRKWWLLRALGLLLCWMPVFLAVFPGFFAYDATDELKEVLTGEYVTRHPLLHVLMLGKTVTGIEQLTGSFNLGIAVYVLVQMAAAALLLGWVLERVRTLGAGKLQLSVSFIFLAFFPVIPMYVLCTSKDIVYTAGMLAAILLLYLILKERSDNGAINKQWTGLFCALFVMAVFRNNGYYVLLVMIPILLLLAGKKDWKKMVVVLLLVLLARTCLNTVLNMTLHPVSTDAQETLTVPIQQMARAWKYSPELFNEEDRNALFEILPEEVLERYNPKLSDMVKIDFQTEKYKEDPGKYRALWLRIGVKAPLTYVNAWFMTSYGFWYPFTVIDVYNGTRNYEESSYFSCETEEPGERQSLFPRLEKIYEDISWKDSMHRRPVISWLFSPGFLCWVYVFVLLFFLVHKRWRCIGVLAPVYLNWLTVLLGPTYLVRYVLIFWFALPLLLFMLKNEKFK